MRFAEIFKTELFSKYGQKAGCYINEIYDIIFLDHMMPHMDGLETFKIMQSRPDNKCKDTHVVMLTANATNGVREEYLKEGFDDFLAKPIDSKLLEEMIVRLLPENLVQYRLEDMD